MIGQLDSGGVLVSPALIYVAPALIWSILIQRVFIRSGTHRFVWRRVLFDFVIFILLWSLAATWVGPWIEKGIAR